LTPAELDRIPPALNPAPPGAFHQPHRDYHARWGLVSRFFESTLMKTIDTTVTSELPWVVVTGAGTDEQTVVGEACSMALAIQFKAELHDSTADVLRRLPSGELTTEF
jgi:hypothetical protein